MGEASFDGVESNGFLKLFDEFDEYSSGRESVRWSLGSAVSCTGRPVPRRCDARMYEAGRISWDRTRA